MNLYSSNISTYVVNSNPLRVSSEFNDAITGVEIRNIGANPVYVTPLNSTETTNTVELINNGGALSIVSFKHGGQWVFSPLGSSVSVVTELVNRIPNNGSNTLNNQDNNQSTNPLDESGINGGIVNIMSSQYK